MESFPQFLPFFGVFLVIALTYSYKRMMRNNTNKLVTPQPSGALPFIGHLHLLRGRVPVARILGKLADEYGPLYSLWLGSRQTLIVSSWQMVKQCLATNDKTFATRPNTALSRYMFYDNAGFVLAPYGLYWQEIRKMVSSELFTNQALEKLKNVRNSEVKNFINELCTLSLNTRDRTFTTEINKWLEQLTLDINVRTMVGKNWFDGKRHNEDDEILKECVEKAVYLSGVFVVSDYIPNLEWMDIGGHVKGMKQVAKKLDNVIEKWFEKHVDEMGKEYESDNEASFMDIMLSSVTKDAEMFGHKRETIIKATIMTLMLTGSESPAVVLTWAISLLLNNPQSLKAAQKELDDNIGTQKWVGESDIKNLRYLQAIVKETLRMYPPGPLTGTHEAIEDCYIEGYHVTKGTRLIVNIWKLHRDPQVWSDPNEFRPERFLDEHLDINYVGHNFEYIPFGTGRRMCPALTYALQVVHLTLAKLLQGFDLSTPMGKAVDMGEGLGFALPKVKPLEVILAPRLSPELYDKLKTV